MFHCCHEILLYFSSHPDFLVMIFFEDFSQQALVIIYYRRTQDISALVSCRTGQYFCRVALALFLRLPFSLSACSHRRRGVRATGCPRRFRFLKLSGRRSSFSFHYYILGRLSIYRDASSAHIWGFAIDIIFIRHHARWARRLCRHGSASSSRTIIIRFLWDRHLASENVRHISNICCKAWFTIKGLAFAGLFSLVIISDHTLLIARRLLDERRFTFIFSWYSSGFIELPFPYQAGWLR